MTEVEKAIEAYKAFLIEAQEQHAQTIAKASAELEELVLATKQKSSEAQKPQSAWVTGNDNEQFLMLNAPAANLIVELFDGFQEVIELLSKQKAVK